MKRSRNILSVLIMAAALIFAFAVCSDREINADWRPHETDTDVSSETLLVKKVEDLPEDFIIGMDASCVPALEAGESNITTTTASKRTCMKYSAKTG